MNSDQNTCLIVSATFFISIISLAAAYDSLDPNGNIEIKWDVMYWTGDGYGATVSITNFQMYRHITSPGWTLGWVWAKNEVIWSMQGAEATDQGDCSTTSRETIPHSCKRDPTVVDLLPGVPYNKQVAGCCKGGVLTSWGQDPSSAVSAFQLTVGHSGTSNKTVRLPKNFTLYGPGLGYTCGRAKIAPASAFYSSDGRRKTNALMTWNVTCTYSQFLASETPTCCVSMSSFYNSQITPCKACACGCQGRTTCIQTESDLQTVTGSNAPTDDNNAPLLQCTEHNCPIQVHWHVKENYKGYWRVKITISNFNYRLNYSQWTLVVQHPNFNNTLEVYSFVYKPLTPFMFKNDTSLFHGLKSINDVLLEAGPNGNVHSEMILEKDSAFTFEHGWAFPRKVYFDGDECVMPFPDSYPFLPNLADAKHPILLSTTLACILLHIFLTLLSYN